MLFNHLYINFAHCKANRLSMYAKVIQNMVLKNTAIDSIKMITTSTNLYGDMFSNENQLPRLPVPDLKQTMGKYIDSLEPITFESELENTKMIVADFVQPGGVGEILQAKLMEKAANSDNWLSEWYEEFEYFGNRDSVTINTSVAIKFVDRFFYSDIDQFRYAAKLIRKVLDFKRLVNTENIPVDYAGKDPLTMGQYRKLLSVCRIPLPKCDDVKYTPSEQSRNVIVAHSNHFFVLDVYQDGTDIPLSEEELIQQLSTIVEKSCEENEFPVGVLTSERRSNWALAYKRLLKDSKNRRNIELIEKSICLISLDQPIEIRESTGGHEDVKGSIALNQFLHGGGSSQNSMNRWHDKVFQFIINRNGMNGFCFEHCVADGTSLQPLLNLVSDIKSEPDYSGKVSIVNKILKYPQPLLWNLTSDIVEQIDLATERIDEAANDVDLRLFKFDQFGKNIPKMYKISPDAFFQVCLQLAYWRLHYHHPPTYESASIRKFSQGRLETIRSATNAAGRFSREMDRLNYDDSGKRELFLKAVQAHVDYTINAMNFQAIDCHMFGLRCIALENGIPLPEVFRDKSFGYAIYFKLLTSQISNKNALGYGFGAYVPDGYGVVYNPMENQFLYSVSSYFSHPKTHSKDFGDQIARALEDIYLLLESQHTL